MPVHSDVLETTEPATVVQPAPVPWLLERRRTAWRAPLAAACLLTAAAHVLVTGEHLREAVYIGALFIALEVAAVALAIGLLQRPTRAALLAISGTGALAVLALVLSRSVGLPLITDDVGSWTEPLALVSVAAELVMAVGGAAAALARSETTRRALLTGAIAGILLLGAGAAWTAGAVAAETGAGTHDMDGMDGHDMGGMDMGLPAAPPSAAATTA